MPGRGRKVNVGLCRNVHNGTHASWKETVVYNCKNLPRGT